MSRFFNVDQINDILTSVKTYIDSKARIFTGSGTANHLAKFTDTNKLGDGPALGNSTTTFLRNDGQWATPSGGGSGTVTSVTINANSPISVNDSSAITTSGTRTLSHATSGATAGSYGDSGNQTPSYGGTFKVPYVTVNNTGHVTGISEHTVKIPASDNTHRPIKMNGTEILGNNTNALDLVAGSNVTLSNSGGAVTIDAAGGGGTYTLLSQSTLIASTQTVTIPDYRIYKALLFIKYQRLNYSEYAFTATYTIPVGAITIPTQTSILLEPVGDGTYAASIYKNNNYQITITLLQGSTSTTGSYWIVYGIS